MIDAPAQDPDEEKQFLPAAETTDADAAKRTKCERLSLLLVNPWVRKAAMRIRWPSEQPVSYAALAAALLFAISLYCIPGEADWFKSESGWMARSNDSVVSAFGSFLCGIMEFLGVVITCFGTFSCVYPKFLEDMGEVVEDDIEELSESLKPPQTGRRLEDCMAYMVVLIFVMPLAIIVLLPFFILHALVVTIFTGKTAVAASAVLTVHGSLLATSPSAWQFVMFVCGGIGLSCLVLLLANIGAISVVKDIRWKRELRRSKAKAAKAATLAV